MSEKAETVTTRAGGASLPPDPAVRRTPRHRRPTGAPPPLPGASFELDSGSVAGGGGVRFVIGQPGQLQTVTITLTATCNTTGAQQIPSGQLGMRRFERTLSLVPRYSGVRYYTFPGGCATYRFAFAPGAPPALATAVDSVVTFMPRSELVGYVRRTEGLALCGRGAACPG